MCQPSEVWTRTDSVSVSGPILKKFSGCFLSTSSSRLTRVMRPLSSPALREDELAGVKKVSKPCILKMQGLVRAASTNDVIQVCGRLSLECLDGLVCGADFTIGLLCEMNLMLNKPKVV